MKRIPFRSRMVLLLIFVVLLSAPGPSRLSAQQLESLETTGAAGLAVRTCRLSGVGPVLVRPELPLFSLLLDDSLCSSGTALVRPGGDSANFTLSRGVGGWVRAEGTKNGTARFSLMFVNGSKDTVTIANVVPFGEGPDRVYITATGPSSYLWRLSRSALFRPGVGPLGVVLPDNAWEMGFCDVDVSPSERLVAIARRTGSTNAVERRFRTILPPGASVRYTLYAEAHRGDWREGLRRMFRDRWLYDLRSFDDSLFRRSDLAWIRSTYLMTLLFAWDEQYYDRFLGASTFEKFLHAKEHLLGPYDVFMIWPTWPRLGVDQRNQFDLYRDMPGGLAELRRQAEVMHRRGGRYFISYNPWDESTRREEHLRGIEDLLRETNSDGVVLDTWGESSREFQAAADRVRPGIVLYSEGMAVPKDMPGIVAGRVHDALIMPPPLNLNKLIKPEFSIFRVMQVADGRLHREAAVCLFNGYGAELNVMRTGRPAWMDEEYRYLGQVLKILRENSDSFVSRDWEPVISTTTDSLWVNRWPASGKTVYTVYGLRPEGFAGPLFEAETSAERHYVSLWHHVEVEPVSVGGRHLLPVTVEGFSRAWLRTRREGNVDCIAWLPKLLTVSLEGDTLRFSAPRGTKIAVTAGDPGYSSSSRDFPLSRHAISLYREFGRYEGKFVIQLFADRALLDERVVEVETGTPRRITEYEATSRAARTPERMTEIPGGNFTFVMAPTEVPNPVIPYPDFSQPRTIRMPRYFIDTHPVTNADYQKFLASSGYAPKDTTNFLRHWTRGMCPRGLENHPVVWVSLEDARAYARWAGKRLPTGVEWQYAAQGTDGRKYPWGSALDSTRCNVGLGHTTPVDAFPGGKSPFGVMDLVGNVWQMTDDIYDNGSYYFLTMRGGSYYNPTSSEWYVRGGVWAVNQHQMLLMLSPGYDRNATVGFRCVKDAR